MSGASSYQLEHLCGGVAGGLVSTLVLHPLDLLKIRFAVNEGASQSMSSSSSPTVTSDPTTTVTRRPQYSSYMGAAKAVCRSQGVKGLYQGLAPNLLGNTLAWGLYFQAYNIIKAQFRSQNASEELSPGKLMLAGVLAGGCTMTVTNPIWVVKTRLCLQYETLDKTQVKYKGLLQTFVVMRREEGWRSFYKGYLPGLVGTSHGAVQFVVYDELKSRYCKRYQLPADSQLNPGWYLTFAAVSKMIAVSVTYPYQVVRARLQDQHAVYNGALDCLRRTYTGEGVRGFYKGMGASLVRVTPATCITFVTYEFIVQQYRLYVN